MSRFRKEERMIWVEANCGRDGFIFPENVREGIELEKVIRIGMQKKKRRFRAVTGFR